MNHPLINLVLTLMLATPIFLTACQYNSSSPSEVYEKYNQHVINGMTFEEEKHYFTKQKQLEVERKIPLYMAQMNKSKEEVIAFYLRFTQNLAKCKHIKLTEQNTSGDEAVLIYQQTDTCGNQSTQTEKQTIKLKYENGWKIDDIVSSL